MFRDQLFWKRTEKLTHHAQALAGYQEHSEPLQFKSYEPHSLCVYLSHSVYLGDLPASGLCQRLAGLKNSVYGLLVFLSQQLDLPDTLS